MAVTTASAYAKPRHSGKQRAGWGLAILLVGIFSLIPVLWIASLSFKDPSSITDGSFIPKKWTWDNYRQVWKLSEFTRALVNSLGITLITTVIAVVLGTMAAYAIARLEFPGKRLLVGVSLAIAIFPLISLVSPLFNMWRSLHLFNTWPGLIIPYLAFSLPLALYTLSAFFREIPWELEQAAAIDGATPFQAFTRVIAPLAAPAVFTTAILVFFFAWNDFLLASALTSTTKARTVPVAIGLFSGISQFSQPIGSRSAAAMIVTIPIIVLVIVFQRRIVAGLTSGAVKG
jgi:multiple sugar transport system permease protein